ncbi:hypothetical protein MKQ70_32565 [Chitinophaga sedimenti]|uniref:hypothetical protein n=1 Tax=Chitinophaga sedimenti TaxID=2033606 RepID=UPI002005EB57|nr:hypothetical protein [Chitinophaga sedimenti]MCK7559450.1 hypothetical protein [Chitinophaga sedimenti]
MKCLPFVFMLVGAIFSSWSALKFSNEDTYTNYGVAFSDANYYYVAEDLTLKEEGTDYLCFENERTCVISSIGAPDEEGKISKVTALYIKEGEFLVFQDKAGFAE